MQLLNIGCGNTFHNKWVNIDISPASTEIVACDVTQGLPFSSASFDVSYSSHVLEHLRKAEAALLIEEQRRILKPGGVIRVVVPDLEMITRNYLKYLDQLLGGDAHHVFRYDYSLLELFDQTVREKSGGELGQLWESREIEDLDYVIARSGSEVGEFIDKCTKATAETDATMDRRVNGFILRETSWRTAYRRIRQGVVNRWERTKYGLAEILVGMILGSKELGAFREGVFRSSGEIHRVMYDSFSLKRLLTAYGFSEVERRAPNESRIPEFNAYMLDIDGKGVRKPDSLFMEGTRV